MTKALIKRGALVLTIAAAFSVIGGIALAGLMSLFDLYSNTPIYIFICRELAFAAVAYALGFFFIAQKGLKGRANNIKILYFLAAFAVIMGTVFLEGTVLLFAIIACMLGFFLIERKGSKKQAKNIKNPFFLLTSILSYCLILYLLPIVARFFWVHILGRMILLDL